MRIPLYILAAVTLIIWGPLFLIYVTAKMMVDEILFKGKGV